MIGEFIGISKLSKEYLEGMFEYFEREYMGKGNRIYCENLFLEYSKKSGTPLSFFVVPNLIWTEIDNLNDLLKAKEIIYPQIKKNEK